MHLWTVALIMHACNMVAKFGEQESRRVRIHSRVIWGHSFAYQSTSVASATFHGVSHKNCDLHVLSSLAASRTS